MKYQKLVRDNIPNIIRARGDAPIFHEATDDEYWAKLKEKLLEEAVEFQVNENEDEIADIYEVIDAIIAYKKFDRSTIMEIRRTKVEKRGGFQKKIILGES